MSYLPTVVYPHEPKSGVDLYLPQRYMRKWSLTPSTISVQFGSSIVHARVSGSERTSQTLVSRNLAQSLHLPVGMPLFARYQPSQQTLVFGPYLGILVSGYNAKNSFSPFGPTTSFFNEVADIYRKRGGVISVFRPQDVDWEARTVRGLIRRGGAWRKTVLSLPQCVYNRVVSRQWERSEAMTTWVQRCKDASIPFFNENFLNKWHVHSALEKQESAIPYLPRMVSYQGEEQLQEMFSHFHTVYFKPANGSMGRGIVRLRRTQSGYQAVSPGGINKHFSNLAGLHRYLHKLRHGKSYLLQQGLRLIGVNGRPTDFRVLVQKNNTGQWAVTSMIARLGQNRIVSNVSRGGSMVSALRALHICGPWHGGARPTPQKLKNVALKLADLLEKALPGHYAELGVDLGVDVNGRIWLLEVNSKPSKTTSARPLPEGVEEPPKRARPSVLRMYDYVSHLCGFPRKSKSNSKRSGKKSGRR